MKFDTGAILLKFVDIFQFWLKLYKSNRYFVTRCYRYSTHLELNMLEMKLAGTTFYALYTCVKATEQKGASGPQLLCCIGKFDIQRTVHHVIFL